MHSIPIEQTAMLATLGIPVDICLAIAVALPVFLIGVMSPGPATLAIAMLSVKSGRGAGLVFAMGVSAGSFCWGVLAALGLSTLLSQFADLTTYIRVAGGTYLLWLAFKAFHASIANTSYDVVSTHLQHCKTSTFVAGLMLHLLNPKAIFVWLAVVSLGLATANSANFSVAQGMMLVCWVFGVLVYLCYALLFSSAPIAAAYQRFARYFDGMCGALLATAGIRLLLGR